ncbi:MAG: response regulator transcription factor [Dehalococcoidia bacterium]
MNHDNGQIRVLVADDHAVFCRGLVYVFDVQPDITVVGEATDGYDAIQKAEHLKPHIVLMDVLMPRCSGTEAMMTIKRMHPGVKVIILTVSDRKEHLFQALRNGADGYLSKEAHIEEIVTAVREAYQGKIVLSPRYTTQLVNQIREDVSQPGLSRREADVLRLVGEGYSNKEIAERLIIGEATVRTYLHRGMEKLNLKNRSEAMVYAIEHEFNGLTFQDL